MRARSAAILGVTVAVAVGAVAFARRHRPRDEGASVVDTTRAVRIVRRDRLGLPEKKGMLADPAHVRALTRALGIDGHALAPCPPDYAEADLGLVLSGDDVYARRNVYVFAWHADADAGRERETSVVSVTSAGCRVGPPLDLAALRRELALAGIAE